VSHALAWWDTPTSWYDFGMNASPRITAVAAGVAAAIFATAYFAIHAAAQSIPESDTKTYTNETFGFSLDMPADFTASDAGQVASTSGEAVVLQHGEDGDFCRELFAGGSRILEMASHEYWKVVRSRILEGREVTDIGR
jgi:hypothetical protein